MSEPIISHGHKETSPLCKICKKSSHDGAVCKKCMAKIIVAIIVIMCIAWSVVIFGIL